MSNSTSLASLPASGHMPISHNGSYTSVSGLGLGPGFISTNSGGGGDNTGTGNGSGGSGSGTTLISTSSASQHSDPIMDFNISADVPCYKVLPLIARRHNVRGDWRGVGLVVCYGDQERMVGLEEKPLLIFKELLREGKNPVFMIREDNGIKTDIGFMITGTPGGLL